MVVMNTRGKVYVITGGTGGMGLAIASRFADKGTLLLADVSPDQLDETKQEFGAEGYSIETMICDISEKDQVQKLADRANSLGKLGALIHTAGLSPALAPADRIMLVNAVGTALLLDAFFELAETDSVALVVASMAGHIAPENPEMDKIMDNALAEKFMDTILRIIKDDRNAAYCLSKRANLRLVIAQAQKWGKKGARIISVSPGLIRTPMGNKEAEKPEVDQIMRAMNPLGRYGEPDEIAIPVEFLCSPAASYINGADLLIDGGITAVLKNTPR
jgi:NAD(P)-dependent dehydrogenase (short-subunit alcohol dehydrogenase family)